MSAEETNLLKQPPLTASPVESCSVKELSRECVTGINTPVRRVRRPHLSTRTKEKASKVAVVATVIAVLGLFTIPFIVHFVKEIEDSTSGNHFNGTCDQLSWAKNRTACPDPQEYTGTDCASFLHSWQDCTATGNHHNLYVNVNHEIENDIPVIIDYLGKDGSEACKQAGIPFLCQLAYTLCDNNTMFQPSKERCYYVTTVACAKELVGFTDLLPDCEKFMEQTHPENHSTIIPITNGTEPYNISCSEQFFRADNDTCLPSCANFKQDSDSNYVWLKTIEIWTASFGFIMSIIVLVISVVRYKAIFTFPSVFLVYMTASFAVIVMFALITFFDQPKLYCKYQDLYKSINNPTTFCTIAGVAFHYCIVSATLWWFFHVSVIFYKLVWPLKAMQTVKYEKYIHLFLVVLGLLIPLPAVIYTLVESKYMIAQFPPLLCLPVNSNIWYYSTILVLNVLVGTGVCMFVPMFWVIHKHAGSKHKNRLSGAEMKIIVVLCYYAVFGISSLLYFGITSTEQTVFIHELIKYFQCESLGDEGQVCDPHGFRRLTNPVIKGISYITMSLVPVANLVFVINWKRVEAWSSTCKSKMMFKMKAKHGHEELHNDKSIFDPHSE